jgi:hypothetical protein
VEGGAALFFCPFLLAISVSVTIYHYITAFDIAVIAPVSKLTPSVKDAAFCMQWIPF